MYADGSSPSWELLMVFDASAIEKTSESIGSRYMKPEIASNAIRCKWSAMAIIGLALALGVVFPTGVLGIVFGLIGIHQTKTNYRGRKAAVWAVALGVLALILVVRPVGCTFYQPPILRPDRNLQGFLDKVSERRYEEALRQGICINGLTVEDFTRWADEFNQNMGHGTVIVAESRFYFTDPGSTYLVYFGKVGWRRITIGAPDWHFAEEHGYDLSERQTEFVTPERWMRERHMKLMKDPFKLLEATTE